MKKTALILILLLSTVSLSAQFGHGHYRGDRHGRHRHDTEVPCATEWQELWNGCHVRLLNDKVYIYDYSGDRITWGDEVILLPSGYYKIRRGEWWRIYEEDGDSTSLYGEEIICWWNGTYCIYKGGGWRVYDDDGDWLGSVWSRDYIELLWNGCYLYKSGSYYYVADRKGERIFNVWGEEVLLLDNGLFRVRRGSLVRYYDDRGEERR